MSNEDCSVTKKLLSTNNMDKATIENEKEQKEEGDLRLHDAVCESDEMEEIERLVSDEPKLVFERDSESKTPLHIVALQGDALAADIAKILVGANEEDDQSLTNIERSEILDLQDSLNNTALHYAAQGRQPELVAALLKWGANPEIKNENGDTPLHLVCQGNTDKALIVAELLLKQDAKQTLINSTNNNEHTPLHKAIGKRAVRMVNFLLQPEFKCNLSLKNGTTGRTVLHYACSESGESESSCEVVKSILSRCNKGQINMSDSKGKSSLHLAAIKRFPRIARILIDEESTNVLSLDEVERTALHYAAEDGCYTKGYQCVEVLIDRIDRKIPKYSQQVNYLFKMQDNKKQTAFKYACINCPAETVQKYIESVPRPKEWLTTAYMSLIYKNCPLAIPNLMNKAFSEYDESSTKKDNSDTEVEKDNRDTEANKNKSETKGFKDKKIIEAEDSIMTDFGLIAGYVDPVDILPQQETRYLKEAMWWDYKAQREVLLHPLTQFFIAKKWQKLRWIIASWILWQLIWLAAYTSLALSYYRTNVESAPIAILGSVVMLVYLMGSVVNEFFEFYTIGSAYILSLTNVMQLLQNVLGFIAIYPVFAGFDQPDNWMKYTTAAGVLLAYIMSMRDIGKLHGKIGLIVEVLKQVLIQIVQVLLCCSPLWMGFTIAFLIIFSDEESLNSSFPGPIVKVFVMMTGEFEYNETFKNEPKEGETHSRTISSIKLLFFLAFLISVPVGFFNLLTGFALDKVMELRERAKVARISKKLEHIYFIESILLSLRPLCKIFSHEAVISFLRRFNVTSRWIDGGLKFETFLPEKIRKSERSLQRGGFREKLFSGQKMPFSKTELPSDVKEEIYALASPPSTNQRK